MTPSFLVGLLHTFLDLRPRPQCFVYFGAGPRTLTGCLGSLLILYLGTQNSFCQYGVQSAVEIKDLRTETSEIFPLRERDLLKQGHTIMEAKSDWSLSSEMKRSGIKVFAATQRLAQSELSLKVKSSNAIELQERRTLIAHPSQKLLVFWLEQI